MAKTVLLVNRFFGGAQTPTGRMLHDVAQALVQQGCHVRVLASDADYAGQADQGPLDPRVTIQRVWTPQRGRLGPWIGFLVQSCIRVPFARWDQLVLLTDPPFLACVALLVPKRQRRIYLWTMDLYPEALRAHGMIRQTSSLYKLLRYAAGIALARMDGVITLGSCQSARLSTYHSWRGGDEDRYIEVPPWDKRPLPRVPPEKNRLRQAQGWQGKKVVLYAGNLGEAHSYEEVVDAARVLDGSPESPWVFAFVVRGAGRAPLQERAQGLGNVIVLDYLPEDQTADLLWSADVHLITMRPGWEGIVVPSKLYGVLMTDAPVLFIGPSSADTAKEIERLKRGCCLEPGVSPDKLIEALHALASAPPGGERPSGDGALRIARFINDASPSESVLERGLADSSPRTVTPSSQ